MLLDEYRFRSCFAEYINELITQKKASGYSYDSAKYTLILFNKFCKSMQVKNPVITKELATAWGEYHSGEAKSRRSYQISVLRQLSLYMISLGCECYIPARFAAKSYKLPYVMTDAEIQAFMKSIDEYNTKIKARHFWILAKEYKVLFRFIYCCGLRVSEERLLKIDDIDFEKCTAIIRHSKGG